MPDLFPPISFFKSNHSRVLFLVSQRCHSIKPPFFPAITPEKFGRQLKKIRLPFGNKGLVSSMLDIQLVDSFFRSDPNPSTSERAGLHFPSAFFGEITLMWLRHNMCFFFHGNPTNWYALHLARCKMHICRWPKNGSHHFLLLLHKLNQQSKPSNFTRNKLDNWNPVFFFFPRTLFSFHPFPQSPWFSSPEWSSFLVMPKRFGPGCKPRRLLKLDCMDYRPSMGSKETP